MLIHGDARAALAQMPDQSVDCIVSDPPYRTISGGNRKTPGRPSGMLSLNDGRVFEHNDITPAEYLPDLFRVLRDPGHIYLMTNLLNLESMMATMRGTGFGIHNLLVAHKNNAVVNRWYMKDVEYVIFGRRGAAFPINNRGNHTCHDWTNPCGTKTHPTEKSVALMRRYVENSSQPGETVLDPFMGSGATGVACQESGRRFIGIEMQREYYLTACRRMRTLP